MNKLKLTLLFIFSFTTLTLGLPKSAIADCSMFYNNRYLWTCKTNCGNHSGPGWCSNVVCSCAYPGDLDVGCTAKCPNTCTTSNCEREGTSLCDGCGNEEECWKNAAVVPTNIPPPACIPNCGGTGNYCAGVKFADSCGNSNACTGTKDCRGCSPTCVNESWYCAGVKFADSCGNSNACTGTKDCRGCSPTCVNESWYCAGVKFADSCGNSNACTGNKKCSGPTTPPTSTPSCTSINAYVNPNPVAFSQSLVFTFTSNRGYQNVGLTPGGGATNCSLANASCSGNPMDGNSCWWRWNCTSGTTAGGYTATFTNGENCSKGVAYSITAPAYKDVCGYIKNPLGGGISGAAVRVLDGGGNTRNLTTDNRGFFSVSGFIANGTAYAVRPQGVPAGYLAPVKSTEAGWNWNYCANPVPGDQHPWADTPIGSQSYECQRAGSGADCSSTGNSSPCRCSFKYEYAPKTCSIGALTIGAGNVSGTFSGKGNNNSKTENVRLYLEKSDGTLLPSTPGGVISQGCWGTCSYKIGECNSTNGVACGGNFSVTGIPAGDYYLHCDLPTDPPSKKCSGNPFCNYENPPMPGGTDCASTGWVSCSNSDNASFNMCIKSAPQKTSLVSPSADSRFYSFSPPIDFSWTALTTAQMGEGCPSGGRYYKAYLATKLDFSDQEEICSNGWSTGVTSCPSYSMVGKPNGTYYWRVDTTNNGQITHSNPRAFTYTENPPAWFQTTDGDVHANDSISSSIPDCATDTHLSKVGGGNSPGVVSWRTGTLGVGTGSVSVAGWQAKTGIISTQNNYEYLKNRLNVDTSNPICPSAGVCQLPTETGTYYLSTGKTLTGGNMAIGKKVVIFAEGDINISSNINVNPGGGFFALVAKGKITFNGTVKQADGFYLTDKTITVATGSDPFIGQGSFIALDPGGIIFSRNLANNCSPAESFSARPDLFINAPPEFQYSSFLFQEVAP